MKRAILPVLLTGAVFVEAHRVNAADVPGAEASPTIVSVRPDKVIGLVAHAGTNNDSELTAQKAVSQSN